jgi:hypothetical protein
MVCKGAFVVQLVDAESKLPFSEVATTDGSLRTHIPLHRDYFVRVKSNLEERVLVNFRVNGKPLGYEVKLGSNASYCGLFSHNKEGKSRDRALRVESNPSTDDDKTSSTKNFQESSSSTTGTIQATFYEAICDVGNQSTKKRTRTVRKQRSDKLSVVPVAGGDYVESRSSKPKKDGPPKKRYLKGAVLSRVEVKYSDTLEINDTATKPANERRSRSVPRQRAAAAPSAIIVANTSEIRRRSLYRAQTTCIPNAAWRRFIQNLGLLLYKT